MEQLDSCFEASLVSDLSRNKDILIAGVDEVGRGCLFGSVVAATVSLPLSAISKLAELGVKDSKKLSDKKRRELVLAIQQVVVDWQIGEATVEEINQKNILQASLLAMKRSLENLNRSPDICLIDGKFIIPELELNQKAFIRGDSLSYAIAAASILAKVWRDDAICQLALQYPEYDLANNKGYPTSKHRLAIKKYGITDLHRTGFAPCREAKTREKLL